MALTMDYEAKREFTRPTPGPYHLELVEIKPYMGTDYTTKEPKANLIWEFELVKSLAVDDNDVPLPVRDDTGNPIRVSRFTDAAYSGSLTSPTTLFINGLLGIGSRVLGIEELKGLDLERLSRSGRKALGLSGPGQRYRANITDKTGKVSGKVNSNIETIAPLPQYPVDLDELRGITAEVEVNSKPVATAKGKAKPTTGDAIEADPFADD